MTSRRLAVLSAVLAALLALSACSGTSKSKSALKEARLACKLNDPPADATPTEGTAAVQAAFAMVLSASKHAAKAASLDSRWNELNTDQSEMLDAWTYDNDVIMKDPTDANGQPEVTGDQQRTYAPLYTAFLSAARSARADCAKAAAG